MAPERAEWLRKVMQAANQVINDGIKSEDPWRSLIIEDAIKLRDRLKNELAAASPSEER